MNRLAFLLLATVAGAGVTPYPLPTPDLQSPHYLVRAAAPGATAQDVPVLFTRALKPDTNPHPDTSFAAFAFTGTATVTVARRDGAPITRLRVLPTHRGISPAVHPDGSASFTIERPGQFALEIDGRLDAHPLLIFADPPETDIPDPTAPGVRWFGPGVHHLGDDLQPLSSGDTLYFAPGALVYGRFQGRGATDVRLLGRGILAGTVFPPNQPNTYTEPHLVELGEGSDRTTVDGVTFLDSPHYNLLLRGTDCRITNVKMIGWGFGTDGISAGNRSVIEDSFFKVNDDAIKLYATGLRVRRCTFWQMENGGAFQLSWNLNREVSDVRVTDCDVVRIEHREDANNRGVFVAVHGGSGHLHDMLFEDIRIEGPVFRLLRLTALLTAWSRSPTAGDITDLTFRNLTVEGPVLRPGIIRSYEESGRFERLTFEHLTIGGELMLSADAARIDLDPATTADIRFLP